MSLSTFVWNFIPFTIPSDNTVDDGGKQAACVGLTFDDRSQEYLNSLGTDILPTTMRSDRAGFIITG